MESEPLESEDQYFDPFTDSYSGTHPLVGVVRPCYAARVAAMGAGGGVLIVATEQAADGTLRDVKVEGAGDAEFARCVADGVRKLPLRKPPAAMKARRWLGFRAEAQGFSLALADAAGRTPLADVPHVEGGVADVEVEDGQVVVTQRLGRQDVRAVVANDGTLITSPRK
jgi:hypothetical protein